MHHSVTLETDVISHVDVTGPVAVKVTAPVVSVNVTEKVGVGSLVTRSIELEPVSLAASRTGAGSAFGATVSRRNESSSWLGTASTLPASSVALVKTRWTASASRSAQVTAPLVAVPVRLEAVAHATAPFRFPVIDRKTVKDANPMSSLAEKSTVTEDALMYDGAIWPWEAGGVVSIVISTGPETVETLPAVSVWVAVTECTPAVSTENVHDTDVDVTEFTTHAELPAVNVTDPLVSPTVAVTVGVVSLVIRSESLEPVSLPEVRANELGGTGATESRATVVVAVESDIGPVFSTVSLAPPETNDGITVPSSQFETVTVRDDPESVPGSNEQFNAVPAFEKSPDATPVTFSENVKV